MEPGSATTAQVSPSQTLPEADESAILEQADASAMQTAEEPVPDSGPAIQEQDVMLTAEQHQVKTLAMLLFGLVFFRF